MATSVLEQAKTTYVTYEAYREWAEQQEGGITEWVDGEVIQHMSVSVAHQNIIQFLVTLLTLYLDIYPLGKLLTAPAEAKFNLRLAREPDLFFISNEQLDQLQEKRFDGAPAFVVEVISPSSVKRDRDTKWKEYRDAGVSEYWVIDPRAGRQLADFYQLDNNGEYTLVATEGDSRYESNVIDGFWINPTWLWEADKLKTVGLIAKITGLKPAELLEKLV